MIQILQYCLNPVRQLWFSSNVRRIVTLIGTDHYITVETCIVPCSVRHLVCLILPVDRGASFSTCMPLLGITQLYHCHGTGQPEKVDVLHPEHAHLHSQHVSDCELFMHEDLMSA